MKQSRDSLKSRLSIIKKAIAFMRGFAPERSSCFTASLTIIDHIIKSASF
ncbi:hypothetical protein [Scytonema sp. PRP1]